MIFFESRHIPRDIARNVYEPFLLRVLPAPDLRREIVSGAQLGFKRQRRNVIAGPYAQTERFNYSHCKTLRNKGIRRQRRINLERIFKRDASTFQHLKNLAPIRRSVRRNTQDGFTRQIFRMDKTLSSKRMGHGHNAKQSHMADQSAVIAGHLGNLRSNCNINGPVLQA